jgi:hypothetical protein
MSSRTRIEFYISGSSSYFLNGYLPDEKGTVKKLMDSRRQMENKRVILPNKIKVPTKEKKTAR